MTAPIEGNLDLLRHILATLAYRAGKALRGAPADFAGFRAAPTARTPAEILAHMGDLLHWALALAQGKHEWHDSKPLPWEREVDRFFAVLEAFDRYLASGATPRAPAGKLFQGPLADALVHTGQIAMLRRLAGAPIRGENCFRANIEAGRAGADQSPPVREFD